MALTIARYPSRTMGLGNLHRVLTPKTYSPAVQAILGTSLDIGYELGTWLGIKVLRHVLPVCLTG